MEYFASVVFNGHQGIAGRASLARNDRFTKARNDRKRRGCKIIISKNLHILIIRCNFRP
jgi:hypothetical protein